METVATTRQISELSKLHKQYTDLVMQSEMESYKERKKHETELLDFRRERYDEYLQLQIDGIKALQKLSMVSTEAEYKHQMKNLKARLNYAKKNGKDTKSIEAEMKALEKENKYRKKLEEQNRKDNNKKRFKDIEEEAKKIGMSTFAARKKAEEELAKQLYAENKKNGMTEDEAKELAKKTANKDAADQLALSAIKQVLDFAKQLDGTIESISNAQGQIDTRLQGSKNEKSGTGSYWNKITSDIKSVAAVSPYVKQEAIVDKVKTMINQGISYNVEQRAFLATISDKIANTFNSNDGVMLRLIRLQQQDSTAARLGMESAMTAFLNNMYETTEYMGAIADGIRGQIEEATALMSAEESIGFEAQVQKWMGSMYSVGMSQNSVNSIAGALGKLAAGDISGLNGDATGNLMIMAANSAGLNISDILSTGLTDTSTNQLLKAMVEYLNGIYSSAGNSKVLQQQFASIYGLSASDLKALANLKTDTDVIAKNNLNYNSAMGRLASMMNTLDQRTSTGEMLGNMWSNLQYSMAEGIANNPITYAIYKASGLMGDLNIGDITGTTVAGTGFSNIDVAGLMRTGAMLGGVAGGIGELVAGIGNSFSGSKMLQQLGIGANLTSVARGTGQGIQTQGGLSISEGGSAIAGGSDDIMSSTEQGVQNEIIKQEEESTETTLTTVNNEIIIIQEAMNQVKDAVLSFTEFGAVKVSPASDSAWSAVMGPTT